MAWRPEVKVNGDWERNSLVFATKKEAEESAQNLYFRWALTEAWRAVETDEPVNWVRTVNGGMFPVQNQEDQK